MANERFWISTGDIRENYDVMNIVATRIRTFLEPDFATACRTAIDNLARAAIDIGANGVIWIEIIPVDNQMGFGVYATGTAVRVTPNSIAAS